MKQKLAMMDILLKKLQPDPPVSPKDPYGPLPAWLLSGIHQPFFPHQLLDLRGEDSKPRGEKHLPGSLLNFDEIYNHLSTVPRIKEE